MLHVRFPYAKPLCGNGKALTRGEVLTGAAAMARGPKKHLKRVAAPKHWMLDKLTGVFVSAGRGAVVAVWGCVGLRARLRSSGPGL